MAAYAYVATLALAKGDTAKIGFVSRATKTGTVATHARAAAVRAGYHDFRVVGVVVDLTLATREA